MTLLSASTLQAKVTQETLVRDLFSQANLLTITQFFKPEFCAQVRTEIRQSLLELVNRREDKLIVDVTRYVIDKAQISQQLYETIQEHLYNLKPQLEQHFQTELSEMTIPNFIRYDQGHFIGWHVDTNDDIPGRKNPKVTTLVYLNGQDEESGSDSFIGGELEVLLPQEEDKAYCLQILPETGLLVAFGSRTPHNVQPIVKGSRYVTGAIWT